MGIDGGGALYAIDVANGHLVCGCGDINYRKPNMTFGVSRSSRAAEGPSQAVSEASPSLRGRMSLQLLSLFLKLQCLMSVMYIMCLLHFLAISNLWNHVAEKEFLSMRRRNFYHSNCAYKAKKQNQSVATLGFHSLDILDFCHTRQYHITMDKFQNVNRGLEAPLESFPPKKEKMKANI